MIKTPYNMTGASLEFVTYIIDDINYYEFDCSEVECPEPMINAMAGLKNITQLNERLVMIGLQEPAGLYPRINKDFSWEVKEIENDLFKITFKKIDSNSNSSNFDNDSCS
ncbi:MAG: hypothetical protein GQ570_03465 [Helicobacteraceae bacterium]|nr:hypothetical protein [Helicobacteraceae bacterium]